MANYPLNYFLRKSQAVTTIPTIVYTVPFERAGILITALASNLTNTTQTVNVSLSTTSVAGSNFDILKNFQLPPNDTTNVVINKLVLGEYDNFIISAPNAPLGSVNITLSVLESVNTR
jgi:hypothetical protein